MKYTVDWIPVTTVGFCAALSFVPLVVALHPAWVVFLFFFLVLVKNSTLCAQHNHAHLPVFNSPILNFAYDVLLAQTTGYGTPEWELQHNRGHHHNTLNPEKDVASPINHKTKENMSRWYFIWQGSLRIFPDAFKIALKDYKRGKPKMMLRLMSHLFIQIAITLYLMTINLPMTIIFFVFSHIFSRAMVWWGSYWHHIDVPCNDIYSAANTHPERIFNLISFNSGYHTAHHVQPALHWSLLAKRTSDIRHKIPDECYWLALKY